MNVPITKKIKQKVKSFLYTSLILVYYKLCFCFVTSIIGFSPGQTAWSRRACEISQKKNNDFFSEFFHFCKKLEYQ